MAPGLRFRSPGRPMQSKLLPFSIVASTLACGTTTPAPAPATAPAPAAATRPDPIPAAQANEPRRLAVHAMALEPNTPAMRAAMEGVFAAWRRCAAPPATGCGYQLVDLAHDAETRSYSLSWAVDTIEGPVATCMARHAEDLALTAAVPAGHHYFVAVAVAPTEAEHARCSAGFETIVDEWFSEEQKMEPS